MNTNGFGKRGQKNKHKKQSCRAQRIPFGGFMMNLTEMVKREEVSGELQEEARTTNYKEILKVYN